MLKFSDIEKYTVVRGPAEEERAAGVVGLVGARADGTAVTPDGMPLAGLLSTKTSTSLLGDSIMGYGASASAATPGLLSDSHVLWANDLLGMLGAPLDVLGFYAVGGATSASVIESQMPAAVLDGTEVSWVHVGVNDFNSAGGNLSVPAFLSNMAVIVAALSAVKKLVVVDAINPVNQAGTTGAKSRAFSFPAVNSALRNLCGRYSNVVFNDTYAAMVDPTSAARNPIAGYVNSVDGIHFTTLGASAAGWASANNILSASRLVAHRAPGPSTLPAFSGAGGTSTPGTGTVSGAPPAGWNVQVVNGSAAVVVSSQAPDITRLTCTNSGGAVSTVYLQVTDSSGLAASFLPGDVLRGGLMFQISGITNMTRGPAVVIRRTGGLSWVGGQNDAVNEVAPLLPTAAFGGFRRFPPFTLPAGVTSLEFIVALQLGATTGACVLDLFAPELCKLT